MPGTLPADAAAASAEKHRPCVRPAPNRRRSLSLAVTTATRAPARENRANSVSERRWAGSVIMAARPVAGSRK